MSTMTPLEKSPSPSLEVLSQKVDAGFAQVDANFSRIQERFAGVDQDIRELRGAVDAMYKILLGAAGGIIGSLILSLVSVLVAVLS
jgi:hypothetical protein